MRQTVNRKELEGRIWGKSIATARKNGSLSEEEAQFLLGEYVKEFESKLHSGSDKPLRFARD
jgi:hypothetical protein